MTTIALVHGAFHGGWCWERLVPELRSRGFDTVGPDMPCDDPAAGVEEYAAVIEHAIKDHDDVVLVGHSLGSLIIPVVASHRPVRRMVFLCSVPTGPGAAIEGQMADMVSPAFINAARFHDADGREMLDNRDARQVFFADCSDADANWAVSMLRPQSPRPLIEPSPLSEWPDVAQSVILTTEDRVLNRDWAVGAAKARLGGADPLLLAGSHSPFVSRPAALADLIAAEAVAKR